VGADEWALVGALAELLGAIGVILSLVYLATQIRQNSKHVEASVYQSTNDAFVNWYSQMAGDPKLADIWYEQIQRNKVQPDCRSQANALLCAFFLALENAFSISPRCTATNPGVSARSAYSFLCCELSRSLSFPSSHCITSASRPC